MSLSEQAVGVITRPLPQDKVKKRPGKAGMEFSYITPDFVIETLNEAFTFNWNTRLVYQNLHDNVAVVGLELSVPAADGTRVSKQQFGSCEVTRGLGVGEAFKGAASDALKKCATLLGLGLELYQDDEAPGGPTGPPSFRPPQGAPARPAAPPAAPRAPSAPAAPPRPPVNRETTPFPPKAPAAPPVPPAPPAAPAAPPAPAAPATPAPPAPRAPAAPPDTNPFAGRTPASVPKPAAPAPPAAPAAPAPPRDNPFANNAAASSGPNATQVNAMTNLAQRKGVSPADLIAAAGVVDDLGHAVQTFEELSRDQAIQVIKAAQQ